MEPRVDPSSPIPIYAQLAEQFRQAIAQGLLPPGTALPTVRQLAVDLRVNMHTVAHAYAELTREGLIAMHRGRGTFVQGPPELPEPEERARRLAEVLQGALGQAATLGFGPEEFARELAAYINRSEDHQ